jgi:hypothetical protein
MYLAYQCLTALQSLSYHLSPPTALASVTGPVAVILPKETLRWDFFVRQLPQTDTVFLEQ